VGLFCVRGHRGPRQPLFKEEVRESRRILSEWQWSPLACSSPQPAVLCAGRSALHGVKESLVTIKRWNKAGKYMKYLADSCVICPYPLRRFCVLTGTGQRRKQ
jgi:hypothetical protein